MLLPPNPEAPRWFQQGSIMYEGITLPYEAHRLHEVVSGEEALLNQLLASNNEMLIDTGISAKVIDLNGAVVEALIADDPPPSISDEILELSEEGSEEELEEQLEYDEELAGAEDDLEGYTIPVNETTQFRVAENIELSEPCDPDLAEGRLYVVIYNGPSPDDFAAVEVGTRIYQPEEKDDIIIPNTDDTPVELHLTELEVATVGILVSRIKQPWLKGRLPHLGDSGYYDTLVIEASEGPELAEAA